MTSNKDALLPCPFCGGKAKYRQVSNPAKFGLEEYNRTVGIECSQCRCSTDRTGNWSQQMFVNKWNRRVASQNPAGTGNKPACVPGDGNKDALEALGRLLKAAKTNDDNKFHHFGAYDSWVETIRAALSQPTLTEYDTVYNAWQLLKAERDDEAFQVLDKLVKCKKQPTYDPETHLLIALEDVPEGLVDSIRSFEMTGYSVDKYPALVAAALIAQKMEG